MSARTRTAAALRRTIVHEAQRCEHWLAEAQARADAGNHGSAICLRFVARHRSEAAFAAAMALRALQEQGA